MYSSLSSTDNGCNSCASLDDAYGSPVQNVNTHTNQYAQPNVLQNHANNLSPGSVAMPQQNNVVAVPNVATMVPPQQSNQSNAQVAMNNMVQKVVEGCKEKGLLSFWFLSCPESFRIAPPLVISMEEIKTSCAIIKDVMDQLS